MTDHVRVTELVSDVISSYYSEYAPHLSRDVLRPYTVAQRILGALAAAGRLKSGGSCCSFHIDGSGE